MGVEPSAASTIALSNPTGRLPPPARRGRAVSQALAYPPDLRQSLLRDGERLDQDGDVTQPRRDPVQVSCVVDNLFDEESVSALDAALDEVAGVKVVMASRATGRAGVGRERTANRGDDEIAGRNGAHAGADLDHLAEALVPEHEVVGARRRRAELEAADLAIGAAHAHLEDPDADVGGRAERRRVVRDEADRALAGEHPEPPHRCLASHHANTFFTSGVSRVRLYASAAFFMTSACVG